MRPFGMLLKGNPLRGISPGRTNVVISIKTMCQNKLANSPKSECVRLDTDFPRFNNVAYWEICTLYSNKLRVCGCHPCELYTVFSGLFKPSWSHLGVDLGGGHMLMPESLLNQPDVTASVVKPCGISMSESVGSDGLLNPSLFGPLCDDTLDLTFGDPFKSNVFEQWLSHWCVTGKAVECCEGSFSNNDHLWISSFGIVKGDCPADPINVPCVKGNSFRKPAASGEHEGQQSTITLCPFSGKIESNQTSDFFSGQNHRRQRSVSSALQNSCRVSGYKPPGFTPSEQGFQTDSVAVDGRLSLGRSTGANLDGVGGHEGSKCGRCDGVDGNGSGEVGERGEVSSVGRDRMRGSLVGHEVSEKQTDRFTCCHGALLGLLCWWLLLVVDTCVLGELYQGISDNYQTIFFGECLAIGWV